MTLQKIFHAILSASYIRSTHRNGPLESTSKRQLFPIHEPNPCDVIKLKDWLFNFMRVLNMLEIQQQFVLFHKGISLPRRLEHTQRVSKIVNS